ncbi:hypothetical protein [Psychrobacter sp. JB385]|uniref:hypothetical protein n=1 Tax=Psychrobacter sp. JB385 TaxID=1434841 RepID=UPI000B353F92|nr:hypothetical protein [Psychrobacter sp. JB385]
MAIQDFTKYLGAQVKFTHKPFKGSASLDYLVVTVEGVISEVLIKQDSENCEFVVDDRFYKFNSVNFTSELLISEVS